MVVMAVTAALILAQSPLLCHGKEAEKGKDKEKDKTLSYDESFLDVPVNFESPDYVYDYKADKRRDPFVNIILFREQMEQQARRKSDEMLKKKRQRRLYPYETVDLPNIKLIGVILTPDNKRKYASIVLPDGKTYVLEEGMPIGVHGGRVSQILQDKVIVSEPTVTEKGITKDHDVMLRLRPPVEDVEVETVQ